MCGINGLLIKKYNSRESLMQNITKMNDVIIHRGPDEEGVFVESSQHYSIGMGMRRLSIIDLHMYI